MSIRILGAPDSTWLRQATPLLARPINLINSLEPVHAVVYVPETERKTWWQLGNLLIISLSNTECLIKREQSA